MQSVTVAQTGSQNVGELTQVAISVTTLNPIPAGGGLQIRLPKWNFEANDMERIGYITQIEGEPICSIGTGMSEISCTLTTSPAEDILVVKNMFTTNERLAGDTFVFFVNNVLNPLSMSPVELTVASYSGILQEMNGQTYFKGLID